MAIILNDNIKINAGKPSESKYLNSNNIAYSSTTEASIAIPVSERYLGLTVLVDTGTSNIEYWWRESVTGTTENLIEKKFSSEQLVGDFITGATNLGYFSGQTGIQSLDLSGTGFTTNTGYYYSEYNWYYADASNVIRIGSPEHSGSLRRAYVNAGRTKSWIWSVSTGAWEISNNDVIANVGNLATLVSHYDYVFTGVTWSGSEGVAAASVTAYGSLTTGDTVTIGEPIYKDKSDQELHLRTILNETPEYIKIDVDDNYIRFSGASSALVGQNIGAGTYDIFTGKTGSTMFFRTISQSGDTTITQKDDGSLVIYSSSDGSASALTGATNIGTGSGIYSGTTARNLQLRKITGSGTTTVTTSGDTIIVDSYGGSELFTDDLTVSLAGGKTFGKYSDGETIPASGKTAADVIIMATFEGIDPTVSLSSSGNDVAFGESGKTVNLNFSYTINTPSATVSSALVEWRRGGTGAWSALTTTTGTPSGYTHNIDDSANRFNTTQLNYRYTVVDSGGATGTTTHNVTPQAYSAPSMSIMLSGTVSSPETQNNREKGNVTGGTSGGTITSNRSLVNITDWGLERRYDGGSYIVLDSGSTGSTIVNIPITADNSIPTSATTITYRLTYTDEYTSGVGGTQSITFKYFSYWGYNTNVVLTENQIEALINNGFRASQSLTWTVTAPASNYTYYAYPSTYSDLTSIMRGLVEDITAWTKLSDVSVTNDYGEALLYTIYRTNATQAYTGDELVFS